MQADGTLNVAFGHGEVGDERDEHDQREQTDDPVAESKPGV